MEKAEHVRAVHIYAVYYGPVRGDRENTAGAGGYAVVGSSSYRPDRGKVEGGSNGGVRGQGLTVMGGERKTPGMGHWQRLVQCREIN